MTDHSASQSLQTDSFTSATTADTLGEAEAKLLEARGIDLENVSRLGWRTSRTSTTGNAIEIPFFKDGVEVNTKTRTLSGEKKFYQKSDAEKCFYNHDAIEQAFSAKMPLLICEGEMDCAIALQCGYMAVSVPDGAPAKRVGMDGLKYSYLEGFPKTGEVIICADGDAAGANLLHDLGVRLGKHRCKWIKYPKETKDLNDVFLKYGERGIHETIKRAEWLKVDGVYKMSELPPIPEPDMFEIGVIPINIRKGDFSVWTGVPSHGKSTFMNHASFIAAKKGWKVAFASFEQTPQTEHKYSLRTLACGMDVRGAEASSIAHADKWIDDFYTFIIPDVDSDEDADLGWLLDKMAACVIRHGVDLIVIDPWNEIEHTYPKDMTATEYTGFAIKQLKKFAKRHQVHVSVVAHPAKMQRNREGQYPVPSLYDIADSAHWANKPDLGVIVHRLEHQTMVKVQKSRYHKKIGLPDEYMLDYDVATQRYSKMGAIYSAFDGQ